MPSYEVKGFIGHLHTSCHAKTMETLVLLYENSHFSMLTSSLLHPKSWPLEPRIALSATTVTASSPSVANRGAHKTVAGLIFGAQKGQQCLHAYMLACSHAYMTTCLHAYMPTWLHA